MFRVWCLEIMCFEKRQLDFLLSSKFVGMICVGFGCLFLFLFFSFILVCFVLFGSGFDLFYLS